MVPRYKPINPSLGQVRSTPPIVIEYHDTVLFQFSKTEDSVLHDILRFVISINVDNVEKIILEYGYLTV